MLVIRLWLAAALAAGPATATASGQGQSKPPAVITWSLDAPAAVAPATPFTATLRASVQPGWKFYAMEQSVEGPRPMTVAAADPAFALDGPVKPDAPPKTVKDTIWSALVAYHDGTTSFSLRLRPATTTAGHARLRVTVRYQACSDELCLRPTQMTLEQPLVIR
jgi:hypothetical protein